ncbi:S-adenosyl-L-methionine-dependent methyltransferase [Moniliophthora roreri MCA 2997]|uniref:S-adenosyl-L-methionine-dependent methyltransferase n=1 Tax=Moniliophthora roreri (strain MCA 2997) TaxID=1381753 RepID=V2XB03_MONRO|nr:S-adenosyl-L-methionine-dependent methyltransferase [Moniliophthora roreri MCA 2997]KAI3622480.1 S-adenosyl-L-methionine-dependent methyltransferase [Moniliophthora roreri]
MTGPSVSSTVSSSPPRTSTITSTTAKSFSLDNGGRRATRLKETQFVKKHGQRLHIESTEKAPYPLSYDRYVLELESLGNLFVKHLRKGSISFLNPTAGAETPRHCLDLGCGTGTWVIDAAKEWPQCEFVGFDLVNVQIPLTLLDRPIADRIRWVHGNFLTTKLPFDDDEFDHIHVQSIASGVPENKWGVLFEEINRVLRPGGCIEFIEDDVMFPSLPRWFTASLRARPRRSTSVHLPDGTLRGIPGIESLSESPSHDHSLLESLYTSVFEHRFINMKPSALLPSYFATYFRHITLGPVISFPMPPLTPLQPLPPQLATAYAVDPLFDSAPDQRSSATTSSPASLDSGRPNSLSFSSTLSSSGASSAELGTRSQSFPRPQDSQSPDTNNSAINGDTSAHHPLSCVPQKLYMLDSSLTENREDAIPPLLIAPEQLDSLNERSLAMHLYRSYNLVLGCQEAIWEELKDRLRNRKDELKPFGWEDDEELEELQNRKKFERLIERYRTDMKHRMSLWSSLLDIDWPLPTREPLSKAELIEEERLREAMLEARRYASPEDLQTPCRSFRVLVGFKP